MKNILFIGLFIIIHFESFAQNIVPNYDFEDTAACPNGFGTLFYAAPWSTFLETPDYFNSCASSCLHPNICFGIPNNWFGSQTPYSGNAYAGISTYSFNYSNARESMGVPLIVPLEIGKKYYVSFYVSRAAGVQTRGATNNLGFRFSTVPYDISFPIPIDNFSHYRDTTIVSDSIGWTKISGSFVADSVYQYLAIGNFYDDANTDTLDMDIMGQLWNDAYYYVDQVCVTADSGDCTLFNSIELNNFANEFSISPNPFSNAISVHSSIEIAEFIIFDITGREIVRKRNFTNENFDLESMEAGIYLYGYRNKDDIWKTGKLVKQ